MTFNGDAEFERKREKKCSSRLKAHWFFYRYV
jgi:hypothetical protein